MPLLFFAFPCPAIPRNAITVHILSALYLCFARHDLHHATFLSLCITLLYLTFATHFIAQLFRCYANLCYTTPLPITALQCLYVTTQRFASAMRFQAVQLLYIASRRITLLYYAFTELGSTFPLLCNSVLRHCASEHNLTILLHGITVLRLRNTTILRWKGL